MAPDASRMPTLCARTPISSIFCTGPGALVRMPACAQRLALKGQAFHTLAGSICYKEHCISLNHALNVLLQSLQTASGLR